MTNLQERDWQQQPPQVDAEDNEAGSQVIRAEIDATRSRLSNQLDQLQSRLQPDNIKQQAQGAVQEALNDSVSTVKEYVNEYVQQINWAEARDAVVDSVRRNPVPAAFIGVGLGWMLLNGKGSQPSTARSRQQLPSAQNYTRTQVTHSSPTRSRTAPYSPNANRQSSVDRPQGDSIIEEIKDGVGGVANQVQESAGELKDSLQRQSKYIADQAQGTVEQIGDQVGNMVEQWQQAGEPLMEWGQEKVDTLTTYTQRSLEENPLLFGAVALAVGAALAMMLPPTAYENQYLGDLREQAVQNAQVLVTEVKEQAQSAFAEVRPDLEKAATEIVENVKQAGKQALR